MKQQLANHEWDQQVCVDNRNKGRKDGTSHLRFHDATREIRMISDEVLGEELEDDMVDELCPCWLC